MLLTENTDLCHKLKKEIKLVLLIIPSFLSSTKYDNAFMHRPHNVFEVHILHWITKHAWNETSSIVSCKPFATLKCFFLFYISYQAIGPAEERDDSDWIILTGRHFTSYWVLNT